MVHRIAGAGDSDRHIITKVLTFACKSNKYFLYNVLSGRCVELERVF